MRVFIVTLPMEMIERTFTEGATIPAGMVAKGIPPGARLESVDSDYGQRRVKLFFTSPGDGVEELEPMLQMQE